MINVFNSGTLSAVQADRLNELLEWKSRFERITAAPPLSFSVLGGIPMIGPGLLANAVQQSDPTTPLTNNTVPAADPSGNLQNTPFTIVTTQVGGSTTTYTLSSQLVPGTSTPQFVTTLVNNIGGNVPQITLTLLPSGSGGPAVFTFTVVPTKVETDWLLNSLALSQIITSPTGTTFSISLVNPTSNQGQNTTYTIVGNQLSQIQQSVTLNGAPATNTINQSVSGGSLVNALQGTWTATTQAANDNSTNLATTAFVANAVSGSGRTEGTYTAAGTTQGTATAITTDTGMISGGNGSNGVILPNKAGAMIALHNNTDGNIKVYPPSGAQISTAIGTNNPITQNTGAGIVYWRLSATQWYTSTIA
jgi:hypothetical protein